MKSQLLILLYLLPFLSLGQHTFLKETSVLGRDKRSKVLAIKGGGWYQYVPHSQSLLKYNACGKLEWSNHYEIISATRFWGHTTLRDGGFAFVCSLYKQLIITRISSDGNVQWSKHFEGVGEEHVSYSLVEDDNENLIVHYNRTGSITQVSHHLTLTSLTKQGTLNWSYYYQSIPIWGSMIHTSDNGLLVRNGNLFFKFDSDGQQEWGRRVLTTAYNYFEPVEVSDGYIFCMLENGTERKVGFYKIGLEGNSRWGGKKISNFSSSFPRLVSRNGNRFGAAFISPGRVSYKTSIIEFDKDLNVLHYGNVVAPDGNGSMAAHSMCYLEDGAPLILGMRSSNLNLFLSRLDQNFQLGCDTLYDSLKVQFEPMRPPENVPLNRFNHSLLLNDVNVTKRPFNYTETTYCESRQKEVINLGNDAEVCVDDEVTLTNQAGGAFNDFMWSTGEQTRSISVDKSGSYWLRAINTCHQDTVYDTISINFNPVVQPNLGLDIEFCNDTTILLVGPDCSTCTYLWNNGITDQINVAKNPGTYTIQVATANNCIASDTIDLLKTDCPSNFSIEIPNVFTPNGDGQNDYFNPIIRDVISFEMKIFSRWGIELFNTNSIGLGWDGKTASGQDAPDGTYFYIVTITYKDQDAVQQLDYKGYVNLFR